jgi:hypothetical protein
MNERMIDVNSPQASATSSVVTVALSQSCDVFDMTRPLLSRDKNIARKSNVTFLTLNTTGTLTVSDVT